MIRTRQRKKGKIFEAVVKVKGSLVSKSFDSYKEAEKWLNRTRSLRDEGRFVIHGPVTVQRMFDAYIEFAEEKGRSTGTVNAARSRFQNHVLPGYGPDLDMTTVTHEEHQRFLTMLLRKGVKAATRNRVRALIRVMFTVAIKNRLFNAAFTVNPFDSIEPTEEPKKIIEYWNQEQMNKFLSANYESHYYPLLLLLLKTGLRIGEALGIHAEQVDRINNLLTINRQFDCSVYKIVQSTKSRKVRRVYLIDEVMEVIKPLLIEGPIFKKPDRTPLNSDYIRRFVFPEACNRAGLKVVNPHTTRHTFAAHYLMNGGDLWDLSKILGHSSTEVTEQRYGHFDLKHVRKRMLVVERKENILKASFG